METKNPIPGDQTSTRGIADRIVDELFSGGAEAVQIERVGGVYRFTGWKIGAKGLERRTGSIETVALS